MFDWPEHRFIGYQFRLVFASVIFVYQLMHLAEYHLEFVELILQQQ